MPLTVINHLTLDGVMQAPGAKDEDTRGGFPYGGWATARSNDEVTKAFGMYMAKPETALLLGHRSYDGMLGGWNARGGPFKDALNNMPKFVASSNSATELPWPNSTLISGDIIKAVAELKKQRENLVMMGSGKLIRSIMPAQLIDTYLLMIHPLVLGSGQRLFEHEGMMSELKLTHSSLTSTGVQLLSYQPA